MATESFDKLLEHPNCQEIISKLINGIKPSDVANWLKLEYPNKDQSHLRLGSNYLKDFIDSNLNLYETLKKDAATIKSGDADKKISASLRNNKTYQERLAEAAGTEIDIKKMLTNIGVLIESRLEQYFDRVQQNPENLKPDYGLIKYFELMLNYAEKFNKIVNQAPDQIIQHNVTVQVMDTYVAVLQDCIRETLAEIDSDSAFLFMEKFNEKLQILELPDAAKPQKPVSQQDRLLEAKILSGKFESIEDES